VSPRPGSLADRLSAPSVVLVVEDEPDIAALLGAFFRASGLGLVHINPSSVEEVTGAIGEHQPICVLLDVMLGSLSGLDVLAAVRTSAVTRDLPVIVVSADGRPGTRQRAEELGATSFVPKPFSVSALFDQVTALSQAHTDEQVAAPDIAARLAEHVAREQRADRALSFALVEAGPQEADVLRAIRAELPADIVIGWGEGREIAVISPGTDAAEASAALGRCLPPSGADVRAGVAESPTHAATADELYMAADAALAEAVETGEHVAVAR
jgi:DNA-binding response OmpR family regulator